MELKSHNNDNPETSSENWSADACPHGDLPALTAAQIAGCIFRFVIFFFCNLTSLKLTCSVHSVGRAPETALQPPD
jgi:hypothetical protein